VQGLTAWQDRGAHKRLFALVFALLVAIATTLTAAADARAATNRAPVAAGDTYYPIEDAAFTKAAPGVPSNDQDPEGNAKIAELVSGPKNGSLTLYPGGGPAYKAKPNYAGYDHFHYKACEKARPSVCSTAAAVKLHVQARNDEPFGRPDNFTIAEDSSITRPAPGLLGNDYDVDGDKLSTAGYRIGALHGKGQINTDGSFTYTSDPNFNDVDDMYYQPQDGKIQGNPTRVVINVAPVDDKPQARNDRYAIKEDAAASDFSVLDNDVHPDQNEPLKIVAASDPAHGTVTCKNSDGTPGTKCSYKPAANFWGTDTFTYTVTDGKTSSTATATIDVASVNDVPVAANDRYTGKLNTKLTVTKVNGLTANDKDVDGNAVNVGRYDQPPYGGYVRVQNGGAFEFFPAQGFVGTTQFNYTASDGRGGTDTGVATITINR
jgi:hypothetical protein